MAQADGSNPIQLTDGLGGQQGSPQLVAGWPMGLLRLRPDRPLRGLAGLFTASKPDDTDLFLVESFR